MKNGVIYKGAQVMVPYSMQKDMLRKIHANHFSEESNIVWHVKSSYGQEFESPSKTLVMRVVLSPSMATLHQKNRWHPNQYQQDPGR